MTDTTPRALLPTWHPPAELSDFYRAARLWRDASVTDDLSACVERFGERVCIRDSTTALTFRELWNRAAGLAGWLRDAGLRRGEPVLVQLPNWVEASVVFHGILMAGGVVVPMTTILRRREVGFIKRQTGARIAVVAEEFRGFAYSELYEHLAADGLGLEEIVWVRTRQVHESTSPQTSLELAVGSAPSVNETLRLAGRDEDVALVIYTSGTTADAKGAIHTHRGLSASSDMCQRWFGLNERDVLFNPSPVSHVTGISLSVLFPAAFGCSVTLMETWEPRQAWDVITRDRTTFMIFATPFLAALTEIAEERDARLDHIRTLVCGGADVPERLARRAYDRLGEVVRMYGATECPNASCGSPWDPQAQKWGTEGRWLVPTEGRVVDPETGADLPAGEVGEAWWRGPQMSLGYLDSGLNEASYTSDGWFRTGDLVRVDGDGWLTVQGRIKDIINRGGEKFSAREIEELIGEIPGVADVAVTPMPDPRLGERVCAWVVLRNGHSLDLAALVAHLRAAGLATQKLPERLELVDEFPRTPSGKIRKQELGARLPR